MISDHTDSSLPKNGRSEKESFTMTLSDVLMLLAMRKIEGKKNNKLILAVKTRRISNINDI